MFWQKTIKKLRQELEDARNEKYRLEGAKSNSPNLNLYYSKLLREQDAISKALAEENRDLVRQLELYKAVLSQLQIPIKLPGKKA